MIRAFSPGMFQRPQSVILLCIDWDLVNDNQFSETDKSPFVDLGVTMQTMMLAAHSLGLGSGPVTSFSKEALRVILGLPSNISPEIEVCIGYAAPKGENQLPIRNKKKITWQDLTIWEHY